MNLLRTLLDLLIVAILQSFVSTVGTITRVLWPIKPVALLLVSMALCSCGTRSKQPQITRTTTTTLASPSAARFSAVGAANPSGVVQTVTETPYESPAYRDAGTALFSRP